MIGLYNPTALLGTCLLFLSAIIFFLKTRYSYWSSRNVPQIEPRWILGNFTISKENMSSQLEKFYKHFKSQGSKFGGVYLFIRPVFVPVDQELLKHILIKDFDYQMNHGSNRTRKNEPLSGHLLNLEGAKWKSMRSTLTPTFTSGKMKMMFQTFMECTKGLKDILHEYDTKREPMDVKEILGRFTTDIIGSCAFGLECNTMKEPDSDFRKFGKKIFDSDPYILFKMFIFRAIPNSILEFFDIKFTSGNVESFFVNLVKNVVEYREKNNVFRQDFMHLLLQLKNRGTISNDEKIKTNETLTKPLFDMNDIIANCFVFFVAGFETSSTTMTFTLYELALNKDIQTKLRNDINAVLKKYDGQVTYDAIQAMSYLDMVLKESLRRHPPVGLTGREVNKDYRIPGTDIILEKGTAIQIPIQAIHMDKEFYTEPEKFIPERFTEENVAKRPALSWMPFGEGPRQCIGLRFGLLQSKVGLITLIKDYEVSLNKQTETPLILDPYSIITTVKGGVWLDIQKV